VITHFASAQTSGRNSKVISYTSTTSHKAKKQAVKKTATAKIIITNNSTRVIPDNRKEYVPDGQLATRTGHQATSANGDEFVGIKDSANKKRKKQ